MKTDKLEIETAGIRTIQEIAAIVAQATHRENVGAGMLAVLIAAYSIAIDDLIEVHAMTLPEALAGIARDFEIITATLNERYGGKVDHQT